MRRLAATLALTVFFAIPAPAGAQTKPRCAGADTPVTVDAAAARAAVACIVNVERTSRGLGALAVDGRLDAASQGHSQDMADRGYFDHKSPEGRGAEDRADAAGYPWQSVYENIAAGQSTARIVMEGWMQSGGHCPGILAPDPIHMGLGLVADSSLGSLWTQMFALPQGTAAPSNDTAPASGCPYRTLSIAPGPVEVAIRALGRRGRRVTVGGDLENQGAGRTVEITARRNGKSKRKTVRTRPDGSFRTTIQAPKGRGKVRVTARAPRVPDVYEEGSDTDSI